MVDKHKMSLWIFKVPLLFRNNYVEPCRHDYCHSYATLSIRAGNDVKTVQDNMGRYSSAFTLDVYVSAHDEAKWAGADNLSEYIQTTVLASKGSELGSTAGKSPNAETIFA